MQPWTLSPGMFVMHHPGNEGTSADSGGVWRQWCDGGGREGMWPGLEASKKLSPRDSGEGECCLSDAGESGTSHELTLLIQLGRRRRSPTSQNRFFFFFFFNTTSSPFSPSFLG